jgi:hypothetical protein
MSDESSDAVTSHLDQERSTTQGRMFGDISYAAEEEQRAEDLRARSSTGSFAAIVTEPWSQRPSRSTGARRRFN